MLIGRVVHGERQQFQVWAAQQNGRGARLPCSSITFSYNRWIFLRSALMMHGFSDLQKTYSRAWQ